jgi:L-iditol 2-dehydrogenase
MTLLAPHTLALREVPPPEPGDAELVVRTVLTGVCGTDVRVYTGRKTRGVRLPSVIGHEFTGVVYAVGRRVTGFSVGDRVVVAPVVACGGCAPCREGRSNVCRRRRAFGYEFDGAFATFVRVPEAAVGNVVRLPRSVSWRGAVLAEPLGCCICGQRKLDLRAGQTVVIAGAGPIGVLHLRLAARRGARVVVSDPSADRRASALRHGAAVAVPPERLPEAVAERTGGEGAHHVILAASHPELAASALPLLRRGGALLLFAGSGAAPLDLDLIHYQELRIYGTSACTVEDVREAVRLQAAGGLDVAEVVSDLYPLERLADAIAQVRAGTGLKPAIAFDQIDQIDHLDQTDHLDREVDNDV